MKYLILILSFICNANALWSQTVDSVASNSRYILILDSYRYSDAWTTQITKNIRKELETKDEKLIVNVCYADIGTRNSYTSDRFGMQGAFSSTRISKHIALPSLLILIGDEGWMLYRDMNLRGKWENIPVLLCGVHDHIMNDYVNFYKYRNFHDSLMIPIDSSTKNIHVTGVMLGDNIEPTLRGISTLIPDLEQLNYVSDRSYHDQYALHKIQRLMSENYSDVSLNVIYQSPTNADSIRQVLTNGTENSSALLVTTIDTDPKVDMPMFSLTHSDMDKSSFVGGYVDITDSLCRQVADLALEILNKNIDPLTIPFTYARQSAYVLNKQNVEHYQMDKYADNVDKVFYVNLPLPVLVQYFRAIMIGTICFIIILFVIVITWRSYQYRKRLVNLYDEYKGLFDEYRVVYDNMPIGIALFDNRGTLMDSNSASESFFQEFSSGELTAQSTLQEMKRIKTPKFETHYQGIVDENSGQENTLMLIIDRSDIVRENKAKRQIIDTIIFAIESSGWGVAQYNIMNHEGFATPGWYDNLHLTPSDDVFKRAYQYVEPEYRAKIEDFFDRVNSGLLDTFLDTIKVNRDGQISWLRYVIKVLRYAPDDGQILVVELMINIDDQKELEQELAIALKKAQESYMFKQAFIANTGFEIREAIDKMNSHIDTMISSVDPQEQEKCENEIAVTNSILIQMLLKVIEMSKKDSKKSEYTS